MMYCQYSTDDVDYIGSPTSAAIFERVHLHEMHVPPT